jgi:hypothetical protein
MNNRQVLAYLQSQEFKTLSKAVLLAMAFAQAERERVNGYILPLFEMYDFYPAQRFSDKGVPAARIADPKYIYRSDDDALAEKWFAECDKEHRAHGFTGPHGHCPALIAEDLQRRAERWLLESACPAHGIDVDALYCDLDAIKRMLELLLGQAVQKHWGTGSAVLAGVAQQVK